jgi:hypothetical protein
VDCGSGTEQAFHGAQYRLPKSLGSMDVQKWDTSGFKGLKSEIKVLPENRIVAAVNLALAELHNNIGSPLLKVAGLNGATKVSRISKLILCVGASHMRRLSKAFNAAGEKAVHVEVINFRATSPVIASIISSISTALGTSTADEVVIILGVLDNCYYKAQCEDGDLIPLRRDLDGRYHVDGTLRVAPAGSTKQIFLQLVSIFKNFPGFTFAVLTPIPRYLWGACCDDLEHAPNSRSSGHADTMVSSLTETYRLWRGMLFREKLKNVRVFNTGILVKDKSWWGSDNVAPSPAWLPQDGRPPGHRYQLYVDTGRPRRRL